MAEEQARIQEILAGLQTPEQQPGLARRLLTQIPQALAILFSEKPAEALALDLNQRQQQQDRERERRERLRQFGAQLQIEDILGRAKEGRQEAALERQEVRADVRLKEAEARQEIREIEKFRRDSGLQIRGLNITFRQNKALAKINLDNSIKLARENAVISKELEKLKSSNNILEQKIGNELTFVLPNLRSGFFTGTNAAEIYDKLANDQKLTPEEDRQIADAARASQKEKFRQELSLVNARSRGSGGGGAGTLYQKAIEWAQSRAAATNLGLDASGQVQELIQSGLPGQGLVLPDGTTPSRFLNEDEQFRYYFDRNPIAKLAIPGQNQTTDIPDEKAVSLRIDDAINVARKEGRSDAEITQRLSDPAIQQRLGANPQQIQDAVARNKVGIQNQVSPEQKRLSEIDKELQRLNPESIPAFETDDSRKLRQERSKLGVAETERKKKERAPNIINDLKDRLRLAESRLQIAPKTTLSGGGTKKDVKNQIIDLKKRLRDAKAANPELADMFKDIDLK